MANAGTPKSEPRGGSAARTESAEDTNRNGRRSPAPEASGPELDPWTFPGWGHAENIRDLQDAPPTFRPKEVTATEHKLGQWRATAICGNDITSSVLYVVALCTLFAGVYAPVALAMVGLVLFLFRKIYAEVGSALPLNGGAYNVLLNTTSKFKASMAACLTLLSYVATAVISSTEALHYLHNVSHAIPVVWGTVGLLAFFAVLNVVGIQESSNVALVIFVLHIATLLVLVVACGRYVTMDLSVLRANLASPPTHGVGNALFFGFAAGLLGISGFESSANFIEEQDDGVFPKTLRNMWIAVFLSNTVVSLLALGMLPVSEFGGYQEALLAEMGARSVGPWLRTWIGIDAFLVLSGAVLTSYVGVTGLVRRMSLDRCLPQFLLKENQARKTPHWITISFFVLCCSILWITHGDVGTLAGVYTLSFLCVMLLFAVGNRLLAIKRGRLPRDSRATWPAIVVATAAVVIGIAGNLEKPAIGATPSGRDQAIIFLTYFAITVVAVSAMFARVRILRALLLIGRSLHEQVARLNEAVSAWTVRKVTEINRQAIVFFTRGDGPVNLRKAIEYVLHNEDTKHLKVVHVYDREEDIPPKLANQLEILDHLFPEIQIDFIAVQGRFGPELIDKLSVRLNVPRNYMFIGCPGDGFPHDLGDLGGVRLIV